MSPKRTHAQIINRQPLNERITCITLRPDEFIAYESGQYLDIILEGERLSYSIATAPLGTTYDLHIRNHPALTKTNDVIIELPFGNCTLKALEPTKPLIFIAGGTGFAPVHAMIQQLHAQHDGKPRYQAFIIYPIFQRVKIIQAINKSLLDIKKILNRYKSFWLVPLRWYITFEMNSSHTE